MTERVKLSADEPLVAELTRPQLRMVVEALALADISVPDLAHLWVGADPSAVQALWARTADVLRQYDEAGKPTRRVAVPLSIAELHIVHSALLVSVHLIRSEEDFHIRTGTFKESFLALAEGLTTAVRERRP